MLIMSSFLNLASTIARKTGNSDANKAVSAGYEARHVANQAESAKREGESIKHRVSLRHALQMCCRSLFLLTLRFTRFAGRRQG